jgi:hypothetical protein
MADVGLERRGRDLVFQRERRGADLDRIAESGSRSVCFESCCA